MRDDTPDPDRTGSAEPDRIAEIAVTPAAFSLAGRHVLVTGAGRGLGQGMAVSAALAGATVTAVARTAAQLDETAGLIRDRGGECLPHVVDVADLGALPAHVREIGARQPIDGVVHAAGVQIRRPAVDYPVEEWDQVLRVNAQAPFFLSTAIAREQRAAARPGSHVFIGSLASTIGLPNGALYAASKTALLGVARTLSAEMAAFGIRANVVGPGYFPTQLNEDLLSVPENRQRIMSRIPMGRMGTPADLAGIVVFLLSDASRYLTGQLVNVDGGWLGA